MQQYSMTERCSQGTLDFLHQLVERNLESVLAANQSESTPEPTPEPVKLVGADVEGLIVECSERVKAMAWKFARSSSGVDVEEFYSIGMLAVCEAAAYHMAFTGEPMAYLCTAAKHDMIDEWRRTPSRSIASLDAPLSDDSEMCLLDVLSDVPVSAASSVSVKRERALHGALDRLPARQQTAVRQRAGLPGYGVHSLEEIGRVVRASPSAAHCLDQRGRHKLRADAQLCKAMGVEAVCNV